MAKMAKITHERLLQVLDYSPETGVFSWKVCSSNRIHVGDRAGVVGTNGHRFITIDREKFQASRLACFYVLGAWPLDDVKMLNGQPDDCSWNNLKEMSRIEAARLRGAPASNTSGIRGVSPAKRGQWKAAITANYKQVNLGIYPTKEEASEIYEFAMASLAGAKTAQECAAALEKIIQYRRKKVAWNRLVRSGRPRAWAVFEMFAFDVGVVDEESTTIAAVDEGRPIGPDNFKWLLKPQGSFDRTTKEGNAGYMKAYRNANPDRWRHNHLLKNYGINEVEYREMAEKQGGEFCFICEKTSAELDQRLAVDHDHETGGPRGLLCKQCNYAMGQFHDNSALMRRAADFLDGGVTERLSPMDVDFADAMKRSPHRDWLPVATLGFGA